MKNKVVLKLGTRKSLLAWAQSGWVAAEIEKLNPHLKVELVGIETQGDKILDIPLSKIEGKEFFVAEIDEALRTGKVDLTVHSLKDLSLERPAEFGASIIPHRANPRDVILFGPWVEEKLRKGESLKIGTSSPRRLENIPGFLKKALPCFTSHPPSIEFVEIRGNVNTRLSRVQLAPTEARALDGVVLAFAGLARLWKNPSGQAELKKLLQGVKWMILPLQQCPTAPGQGALAIEYRKKDLAVYEALAKLHHEGTARQIQQERKILKLWGGGCHQKLGATQVDSKELGELFFIKGRKPTGELIEEFHWSQSDLPVLPQGSKAWDGSQWRLSTQTIAKKFTKPVYLSNQAVFVAHWRAAGDGIQLEKARVWTSGVASWYQLAKKGIWVEGCAESLGFQFIESTLSEEVLQLPELKTWIVLTHDEAVKDWESQVISTYKVETQYSPEATQALEQAQVIYWSSGSQYDALSQFISKTVIHCCGPGKTAVKLRELGQMVFVFPSVEEWRKWISK